MAVSDQIKLYSEGSRRIAKRQKQKLIIISNESIFENILWLKLYLYNITHIRELKIDWLLIAGQLQILLINNLKVATEGKLFVFNPCKSFLNQYLSFW